MSRKKIKIDQRLDIENGNYKTRSDIIDAEVEKETDVIDNPYDIIEGD